MPRRAEFAGGIRGRPRKVAGEHVALDTAQSVRQINSMRSDRPTRVLPVECSALRTPHGLATCPFLRQARGKFVWNKQLSYVAISLTIAGRYVLDIFMSA